MAQSRENFAKRYPLTLFFVLATAISWFIFIPGILTAFGRWNVAVNGTILTLLASFGPLLAALVVTLMTGGLKSGQSLFSSVFNRRFQAKWLAASTLILAGVFGIAVAIAQLTGTPPLKAEATALLPLLLFVLLASLGEEVGWRGFALPKLQQSQSPLKASLILSIFWWFWHLPIYWIYPPAVEAAQQLSFVAAFGGIQLVVCLVLGFLCAWVYNGSKGSTLMPILLHACCNAFHGYPF